MMTTPFVTLAFTLLSMTDSSEAKGTVYKKDGDLIIGGLIMVHGFDVKTQTCGNLGNIGALARVEAIAYAVEKINNDSTILDGFTVGYEIYDTCASTAETTKHALQFIPPLRERDDVIGIVGPQRSAASIQTTNVLSVYNIPMISFLSTSDALSNSERYPYFLRTVPPDKFQVSAMTDILVTYNWKYVAFLYADDAYGKSAEAEFFIQAKSKEICIGYSRAIPASAEDLFFNATVNDLINLRKDSLLSVVILFVLTESVHPFFKHVLAAGKSREFIWIGSDAWGNFGLDPLKGSSEGALGAFTIVPRAETNLQFSTHFKKSIHSSLNPWMSEFVDVAQRREELFPQELPSPHYESLVIDSVDVLARGLNVLRQVLCNSSMNISVCRTILFQNRRVLRDNLLQVSFTSVSSNRVAFNDDGDSKGRYDIRYLRQTEDGKYEFITVGSWVDGESKVLEIGNFSWYLKRQTSSEGSTYSNDVPRSVCRDECGPLEVRRDEIHGCCWTCRTCEDNEIIQNNKCVSCFDRQAHTFMWPNHNLTQCIILDYIQLRHEGENIAIITIASVGLTAEMIVAFLYIKNRENRLIKASSRELGYIIHVGVCLSYSSAFLYSTPPSSIVCFLRRLVPHTGRALIYISLATMTIRLYRIFRSAKKTTKRTKFISPKFQVLLTLAASLIPIIWGLIWIYVTPPDLIINEPTKLRRTITTSCMVSSSHRLGQLAWDLFVVLVCCYFAFKTRNLPANYNQTRFIAFCVFSTLVVYIAFAPAFFLQQDTSHQNLYAAIGAIIQSTVVLLLIFVARLYALYFVGEEDQKVVILSPSQSSNVTQGNAGNTDSVHVSHEKMSSFMNNSSSCQIFTDSASQTLEADTIMGNGSCNETVITEIKSIKSIKLGEVVISFPRENALQSGTYEGAQSDEEKKC